MSREMHQQRGRKHRRSRRARRRPGSEPLALRRIGPPEYPDDPHRLARGFLQRHYTDEMDRLTIRHWGGGWWVYEGNRYRLMDDTELTAELTRAVKHEFDSRPVVDRWGRVRAVRKSLIANVANALLSLHDLRLSDIVTQPAWLGPGSAELEFIAMENGLFDLERFLREGTGHVRAHTPEWFTLACLPYPYQASADCQRWLAFLDWMFEGDQECIRFVQEWFGYCLVPDASQQRFMIVVGPGANGKSVLLEVLVGLVGEANCSSVPLEDFREQFRLQATVGKLVNIVAEIGDVQHLPEGTLKAFVAGDRMSFNRKYRVPLELRPTARLVFATNAVPTFFDESEGMWRRLIVLPANAIVPVEQQDKSFAKRLQVELPGIFNWAMEGLMRLRKRGHFDLPSRAVEAQDAHRADCDPERAFLAGCLREDPSGVIAIDDLRRWYDSWCADHGRPVGAVADLGTAIRRVFPRVERKRRGARDDRQYVYVGVSRVPGVLEESTSSVVVGHSIRKESSSAETRETPSEAEDDAATDGGVTFSIARDEERR